MSRLFPTEKRDYFGSIPLEKEKVRHQGSRTAREFKNRTLKTEGCGTQNRLGAYICATRRADDFVAESLGRDGCQAAAVRESQSRTYARMWCPVLIRFISEWLCHDLIFILVYHVTHPIRLQRPHRNSVMLQDKDQISDASKMFMCAVLEPRNRVALLTIEGGLRRSKPCGLF